MCTYIYINCTDFLLYSTICKHIHLLRFRERHGEVNSEREQEFGTDCDNVADAKTQEVSELAQTVKDECKSDIEIVKRKCQDVIMEFIEMVQKEDERHLEAVKYLLKGAVALNSTLERMKKNLDVVKLDHVLKIA